MNLPVSSSQSFYFLVFLPLSSRCVNISMSSSSITLEPPATSPIHALHIPIQKRSTVMLMGSNPCLNTTLLLRSRSRKEIWTLKIKTLAKQENEVKILFCHFWESDAGTHTHTAVSLMKTTTLRGRAKETKSRTAPLPEMNMLGN